MNTQSSRNMERDRHRHTAMDNDREREGKGRMRGTSRALGLASLCLFYVAPMGLDACPLPTGSLACLPARQECG